MYIPQFIIVYSLYFHMVILSNSIDTESCILRQTDSSSTASWLKK
jgi:hypothetical protein